MCFANKAKRQTAQMKSLTFNPFDPISIIEFSDNFKLTCITNAVHKDEAMRWLHFFVNKTANPVLNARLSAESIDKKRSRSASGKIRYPTTYAEVSSFSMIKFTTDEVSARTESEVKQFTKLPDMTPSQYAAELVTKTLRCENECEALAFIEMFIKGLDVSTFQSMREYGTCVKEEIYMTVHSTPHLC